MPTITISRTYGSGGRKIATHVRELLGYRFFDKLFMSQLASEVGLSQTEIVDFSEEDYKVKTFIERLMSINTTEMVVSPAAAQGLSQDVSRFDNTASVELVKLAIRVGYERSNLVIVGRGAQVILRNEPDVLHVRVIAPMATRLRRLQEVEGLSLQAARQQIEKHDKAGREYLERFFNAQLDDPYLYHLTINTGYCDLERAAQLIVVAAQQLIGAKAV